MNVFAHINWKKLLLRWEMALILILILEIIIFGSINQRFLKVPVLLGSINDYISICIIALFGTIVMITGGIDISGGAIVGLTSMILGLLWQDAGLNIWTAVILCLVTGILCGALNGFLVSYVGVQAMVVTLAGLFLYSGLAVVLSTLSVSSAYEGIGGFPEEFIQIAGGRLFGVIPNPFIIFLILVIIAYVLLHKSRYGRYVFLVGVNPNAASFSGINHKLVAMFTYVLSGLSASIAGVVLTSYLGSCRADLGNGLTMPIVTAVVLGGTAITGGRGSILGTALAAIVIGLLRFGLQMSGVSTQYLDIPVGLLLIVAVAARGVSTYTKRRPSLRTKEKKAA
ncbi:ABC transporter permease [Anoxybacterium hadale]|uniref:ABC transporter permease n=1 Tax=Anoxybacterium hadale TaxID=3408580 RepID=A0ACD1A6W5_9FIRM|nr:ABC transporter permease [Clostridiales bacterium]